MTYDIIAKFMAKIYLNSIRNGFGSGFTSKGL